MHVEIQVALNFLISFLYNKLPRRRVNQFGEELEIALKAKFANHWYPDLPAKGSAYRCLKTANPLDPVFEVAARNCGLELADVQEYLPSELTIWVEPGEVSYRMSEKSPVKLLYQENEQTGVAAKRVQTFNNASEKAYRQDATKLENNLINTNSLTSSSSSNDLIYNTFNNNSNSSSTTANTEQQDQSTSSPGTSSNHSSTSSSTDSGFNDLELSQQRKVRSFNPEAQCFKPIESSSLLNSFNNQTSNQYSNPMLLNNYNFSIQNSGLSASNNAFNPTPATTGFNSSNVSTYFQTANASTNALKSPSNILPAAGFTKQTQTMTTAQFAQTKFGSTKLKTTNNSSTGPVCGINGTTKRNYTNRMSPTEFSNYIKQRALLQQQQAAGINNLSQSLNGHQLQIPNAGSNNFGGFGSLFNGLSPQQSRSISPISNQDNFLLMAAAAASTNSSQMSSNLNSNNLMRTTLSTNNTPPISGLNSSGNSICSSLSSNSGSSIMNNTIANQNLLSPSSNSAPSGESLLSDINYLSELFNNTNLSPILGNSASLNNSSSNVNSGNVLNSGTINNPIKPPNSINRFNSTPTSFLDMNANNFANFGNSMLVNKAPGEPQFNQIQQDINNNQAATNQQQNQANQNNQNSTKSNDNNDKQFDSYSMSNGAIIYPNQYQHLLVAN